MDIQQFQNAFNTKYQKTIRIKYKTIDILIEEDYTRISDVQPTIKQVYKKFDDKTIFEKLLINFKNKITQRDSNNVDGNTVKNQYGYNYVISIGSSNITKTLFHQLGHIYSDKYFNGKQEQIYDFCLSNDVQASLSDLYISYQQFIPQIIACYYYDDLVDENSKKIVEKYIIKRLKI